jgi:hypothetical protein
MKISYADQLTCAKRELALRKSAYPKWVATGRMTRDAADTEIARMQAIVQTLEMHVGFDQGAEHYHHD